MNNIYYIKTPYEAILKAEDDGEVIKKLTLQEHACMGCLNAAMSPLGYRLKKELTEYFDGERKVFDIPVDPFVLERAGDIYAVPYGETAEKAENIEPEVLVLVPYHRILNGNMCSGDEQLEKLFISLREHEKANL